MCLPTNTDQPDSSGSPVRSMFGMGVLMLLACLGGPALAGLGVGALVGPGGVAFALGLCAAVPAVLIALRRRSARRAATPEL